MTLYLPVGCPAAGKSLLSLQAWQAGRLPVEAILCPDEYRQLLTGDIADQSANSVVFNLVASIMEHRLSRGLPTWLDATNATVKIAGRWVALAGKYGRPVTVIGLCVPLGVALERNRLRATRAGRPEVPEHVVRRMHQTATATWEHYRDTPIPNVTAVAAEDFRAALWQPAAVVA